MSTETVAQKFADACKAGRYEEAEAMWADDVVSVENMDGPMKELRGREAVHGKGVWWFENHEIHSNAVEGPFINGDRFALIFHMDTTVKETGVRTKMDEVALYTVRGGKIAEERFFY
jgi:ketosteroid isomerase-like protein